MYAKAFVQTPAEGLPRIFRRARRPVPGQAAVSAGQGILVDGLELAPGRKGLRAGRLDRTPPHEKHDVTFPLWTRAARRPSPWTLRVQLSWRGRGEATMARAYVLDPRFRNGTIDDFYVSFYGSLPDGLGGDRALRGRHVVWRSEGRAVSPRALRSYAQAISVPTQTRRFRSLLESALRWMWMPSLERLANILSQRRAPPALLAGICSWIRGGRRVAERANHEENNNAEQAIRIALLAAAVALFPALRPAPSVTSRSPLSPRRNTPWARAQQDGRRVEGRHRRTGEFGSTKTDRAANRTCSASSTGSDPGASPSFASTR
jgi:hypothetical protein